ncbi:hypothetical protein COLO4_19702 [Corchorus olitorius]|uniref:Myb/SANT-like domain-containing protein n=1 Tax=Corchorus olitorius TaxID=93759 RepID=A0A1R3J3Y6_9ROSI|nr:hypothetical protein COLO4_19702 [Corchorus olitorius]
MAMNREPRMGDVSTPSKLKNNKRSNHQWTPSQDIILVECCLELVNQGWKAENEFRGGFYIQVEKLMSKRISGCNIKGDPHIKSRIKTLKTQYRELRLLRSQGFGFGWDDINKCITCEDDTVWDGRVKSHKDAAGLRNKPFPSYDSLVVIYGTDQSNGEGVESAFESVQELDKEQTILETAEAAAKAHKGTMKDDFFGVDVELDDINETVFKSSNGTSNNAAKKTPQPDANVHSRKIKVSPGESSDESIGSQITKLTDVRDATRSEIGKVAT